MSMPKSDRRPVKTQRAVLIRVRKSCSTHPPLHNRYAWHMTANDMLFQIATAVFAVTGVLAAARQNMDVMSFVIIGVVTAIGGGTLRDLMLDTRVFWLEDPTLLYVASAAAIATFFFEQIFRATYKALLYLDAFATAVFTILAIEKTLRLGFGPGVAVVMGVITGIGGG